MQLDKSLKNLLLTELIVPMVLLVAGVYGGLMQVLFRAGIVTHDPFLGGEYYQGLTLHGVLNAIVFTTFFAVAFGNALVSYSLKKKINMTVAWTGGLMMLIGSVMAGLTILAGKATVLYTFYPPLKAHPLFYLGAALLIVGSWISFFNWIPVYLQWRKEHPGEKTPLTVVGIFATFIVWLIASASVAVEVLFLLLPWSLGWTDTVNVMLARTLFWFFGHPLVYFWLLPAYVMFYTMMPRLAGGKLYSDKAARLVFILFILFSIPVGTHHQYMDPAIGSQWKFLHAIFTFAVAVPSLLTAFTLAASLEYAGRKRGGQGLFGWMTTLPYFDKERWLFSYLIAGLIIFVFGGISGIVNASYNMNTAVHNTSWIPGHFHLTVAGPVLLSFLGMSLYMLSKLTGKEIKFKGFAFIPPYFYLVGVFIFSWGMMRGGLQGMPRRTNMGVTYANPDSPLYRPEWVPYEWVSVVGGVLMFTALAIFFLIFFATLIGKAKEQVSLEFPITEAYHDEAPGIFANFKPWVITAIILIIIAYTPVLYDVSRGTFSESPAYLPNNPIPIQQIQKP